MNLKFSCKTIEKQYDNASAMNALKIMMHRGEQLSVRFYTSKDNFPCAWIESKKIAGFKLILNQEGLNWLRTYLQTGETEDFGFNPNDIEAYSEEEDKDIQLAILMQLIADEPKRLQFIPLFREKGEYISAYASYMKGKIFFRVKNYRTRRRFDRERTYSISRLFKGGRGTPFLIFINILNNRHYDKD